MDRCACADATSVSVLLSAGADPNRKARDGSGRAPLHVAAEVGQPRCVRLLLGARADASNRDGAQRLPFDYCRDDATRALLMRVLREASSTASPQRLGAAKSPSGFHSLFHSSQSECARAAPSAAALRTTSAPTCAPTCARGAPRALATVVTSDGRDRGCLAPLRTLSCASGDPPPSPARPLPWQLSLP